MSSDDEHIILYWWLRNKKKKRKKRKLRYWIRSLLKDKQHIVAISSCKGINRR